MNLRLSSAMVVIPHDDAAFDVPRTMPIAESGDAQKAPPAKEPPPCVVQDHHDMMDRLLALQSSILTAASRKGALNRTAAPYEGHTYDLSPDLEEDEVRLKSLLSEAILQIKLDPAANQANVISVLETLEKDVRRLKPDGHNADVQAFTRPVQVLRTTLNAMLRKLCPDTMHGPPTAIEEMRAKF